MGPSSKLAGGAAENRGDELLSAVTMPKVGFNSLFSFKAASEGFDSACAEQGEPGAAFHPRDVSQPQPCSAEGAPATAAGERKRGDFLLLSFSLCCFYHGRSFVWFRAEELWAVGRSVHTSHAPRMSHGRVNSSCKPAAGL